jgi:glucokinase
MVREEGESVIPTMVNGKFDQITAQTVYDAAKAGDQVAQEIVRDTARYLGAGIANLLNIFNPDTVVIAGGVTAAGEALFDPLHREVRRRAFRPAVHAVRIVPGELPGSAGVVGAVASFKQQHLGGV